MNIQNEKNHVLNIKLAKLIGLYQTLDPGTVKYLRKNVYHIVMACIMLCMCVGSMILSLSGFYYWTVNMPISIDYIWKAVTSFYLIYKLWIVIRHSDDIWNCLSITRYGFTTFSNRNRYILDRWRGRSVWLTTIYAVTHYLMLAFYLGGTLVYRKDIFLVKNLDGSVGFYRQNVLNYYHIVSDETYNAHYYTFYFFETLQIALMTLFYLIFDTLLVTLCFAICGQMQMICSAFESVGHKPLCDANSPSDYTDEKKKTPNEHDLVYDELKTIIMDHQAVMKKYEDFLTLFRPLMLLQIFVSSITIVTLWFIFIMSFSHDDGHKDSNVVLKKMICAIPPSTSQLFIMCYLFGNIHNQKDAIIFGLYSSNWTEMDMKCKKLILLTMKINNAYTKKLRFSRTKIVDLEMFFKTMGNCYTVISVLRNHMKN